MAITYPLDLPAHDGLSSIELTMMDNVALTGSPFTFDEQTQDWGADRWSATMTFSDMSKEDALDWEGWLASLHGIKGYFLAGDTTRSAPAGTATSGAVTGASGDTTVTATLNGTLKRGDKFQLGTGADATLHAVTVGRSGDGSLEIWPALRKARSATPMVLTEPKGVFRLADNRRGWGVGSNGFRQFSIPIVERI